MKKNETQIVILLAEDEEYMQSFWRNKTPCWHMCHCPDDIRSNCPAFRYQHLPCWEIEGTYLKLSDDGSKGDDTSICQTCRVYRRYGEGRPIRIKLRGKGLDESGKSLKAACGVTA